jgi:hypothetical protein
VHDTLEAEGLVGRDRRRAEGQGLGAACLQDGQDRSLVLATLSWRELVPAIWLPDPEVRWGA